VASLRRVRRNFREEVLRLIRAGEGDMQTLLVLAGRYFGNDVGYEVLIKTFLGSEVSNAVSYLRSEGEVETVGKQWKMSADLQDDDIDIISVRRLKRLRGELTAEARLHHQHGRIGDAEVAGRMLSIVSDRLAELVSAAEAPVSTEESAVQ
jgi:hypothetical protein